jgi:hypothetical protein
MLSKSGTRALAVVAVIGTAVAGCSEIYFDRRDSIALSAGDAVASNKVTQTIDPWPRNSTNNRLAANGQLMQAAQDRYNRGKVITPVLPTAASKDYQMMQQTAAGAQSAQATSATPAAAVKGPGNGSNP